MQTPMLAEPLVAAAEAAVEEATLEAAVLVEEEPAASGHSSGSAHNSGSLQEVATRNHFHNSNLLHLCVTAYSQTHLSHTSVIPDSIIPLYGGVPQENKFTILVQMFCYVSTKADQRLQNLFTNYHNFSCRCNQHTNMMQVCKKTSANMTECCKAAKKPRKGAIHFLKDIFRDTTQRKENAFYTALPSEKNNTGREKLCSPGGGGAATLGYGAAVPL